LKYSFSLLRRTIGGKAEATRAVVGGVLNDLAAEQVALLGKEGVQVLVRSAEGEVGDV
jgi:hypothetical protein